MTRFCEKKGFYVPGNAVRPSSSCIFNLLPGNTVKGTTAEPTPLLITCMYINDLSVSWFLLVTISGRQQRQPLGLMPRTLKNDPKNARRREKYAQQTAAQNARRREKYAKRSSVKKEKDAERRSSEQASVPAITRCRMRYRNDD